MSTADERSATELFRACGAAIARRAPPRPGRWWRPACCGPLGPPTGCRPRTPPRWPASCGWSPPRSLPEAGPRRATKPCSMLSSPPRRRPGPPPLRASACGGGRVRRRCGVRGRGGYLGRVAKARPRILARRAFGRSRGRRRGRWGSCSPSWPRRGNRTSRERSNNGTISQKVVFVSGAARGQGRSHAVRFAAEGADIIGVDMCQDLDTVQYSLARENDLAETVRQVEALGRRMVASGLTCGISSPARSGGHRGPRSAGWT